MIFNCLDFFFSFHNYKFHSNLLALSPCLVPCPVVCNWYMSICFPNSSFENNYNTNKTFSVRPLVLCTSYLDMKTGPSWSRSYSGWIYNCLCNHCLSPLTLWVRIPPRRGVLDTTLCYKVFQWLATGRRFSPDTLQDNWNVVKSGVKHHNTRPSL